MFRRAPPPRRAPLVGPYCLPVIAMPGHERFAVRQFTLRRGYEGPQVILSWESPEHPENVNQIRIYRKLEDIPAIPGDGELVYEGSPQAGYFSDRNVEADKCYGYAVFHLRKDTNRWFTLPRTQAAIIPVETAL